MSGRPRLRLRRVPRFCQVCGVLLVYTGVVFITSMKYVPGPLVAAMVSVVIGLALLK